MVNITVLVSGGGTNLQAVIDGIKNGKIKNGKINLVIASNPEAYALERAQKENIPTAVIGKSVENNPSIRSNMMIDALKKADTDIIVLAGYMSILPPEIIKAYGKRIINIHPSLIPKHCGKGFYGMKVHESVMASGDEESGATVHFVDEGVDTGEIIIQKSVPVFKDDVPEALAARVLEVEHTILVEAINKVIADVE
jgi:phosphoribosylglycinamide formyltransferase-1